MVFPSLVIVEETTVLLTEAVSYMRKEAIRIVKDTHATSYASALGGSSFLSPPPNKASVVIRRARSHKPPYVPRAVLASSCPCQIH